jgi:hypothetical protein
VPHKAPQTPDEIKQRLRLYYEYYDLPHEKRVAALAAEWEKERQHRKEWVRCTNQHYGEYKAHVKALEENHKRKEERKKQSHLVVHGNTETFVGSKFYPPAYMEPSYEPVIRFPYNIFKDPNAGQFQQKIFEETNPKCKHGFIHREAAYGGDFDPCEVVHCHALMTGRVGVPTGGNWGTSGFRPTQNMKNQTY